MGLALAEGLVRGLALDVAALQPLVPRNRADEEVHMTVGDTDLLYRFVPGTSAPLSQPSRWGVTERVVSINALGHRDRERDPSHHPDLRILAVGGSNTYGAVVGDDATWPRHLERELVERTGLDVEVWNLGSPGYMTRQKLALLDEVVPRARPDLILLQHYNTGPRYFFWGDPLAPRIAADPGIWAEVLRDVPGAGGAPPWWFRGFALGRLGVVLWNRWHQSRDPAAYLEAVSDRTERQEVRRLRAALGGPLRSVPTVAFLPPAGGPRRQLDESGIPWFELGEGELPPGDEIRHVHPGDAGYRWYGSRLADLLISQGCVDGRGPCFGAM